MKFSLLQQQLEIQKDYSLIQAQQDTIEAADTLSEAYGDKWDSAAGIDQAGPLIQAMASYDLIFIVLGVSLVIWFTLLFFIIRLDKKVGQLEHELEQSNPEETL